MGSTTASSQGDFHTQELLSGSSEGDNDLSRQGQHLVSRAECVLQQLGLGPRVATYTGQGPGCSPRLSTRTDTGLRFKPRHLLHITEQVPGRRQSEPAPGRTGAVAGVSPLSGSPTMTSSHGACAQCTPSPILQPHQNLVSALPAGGQALVVVAPSCSQCYRPTWHRPPCHLLAPCRCCTPTHSWAHVSLSTQDL